MPLVHQEISFERRPPSAPLEALSRVIHSSWLFPLALSVVLAFSWWVETINLLLALSGGPDEGVYLAAARLLNHGYSFNSFFFDQFALFPQILALALRLGGDSVMTGRLTITFFSVLGLLGIAWLVRSMSTRAAALLAVLITISNSYYLEESRFVMAEVPAIALMVWALVAVDKYTHKRQRAWLVAGAAACAASLLIKPLTIGLALPIAWWLIASRVVRDDRRLSVQWRELGLDLSILAVVGVLTAALSVNLSDLRGEFQRTVMFHLQETRLWAPSLAERLAGLMSFLAQYRGWAGTALLGAVVAVFKMPNRALPLVLAEFATALVLAQLSPAGHYYAILAPPLAIFSAFGICEGCAALLIVLRRSRTFASRNGATFPEAAPAMSGEPGPKLWRGMLRRHALFVPILVFLTFLISLAIWVQDAPQLARYDYDVLRKTSHDTSATVLFLKQHTSPGDFLITDDPMVVFRAGGMIPPPAINLSYPSTFQLFAVSGQKLEESVRDYDVKAFVVDGPFSANVQLMQWIAANYPIRKRVFDESGDEVSRTYWREFQ